MSGWKVFKVLKLKIALGELRSIHTCEHPRMRKSITTRNNVVYWNGTQIYQRTTGVIIR